MVQKIIFGWWIKWCAKEHLFCEDLTVGWTNSTNIEWFVQSSWVFASIDEVMVQLVGRSSETHCMKNKPIGERNNLLAVVDARSGYVIHFIPGGRMTSGRIESSNDEVERISSDERSFQDWAMIHHLVGRLKTLVLDRICKFVVTMDAELHANDVWEGNWMCWYSA